MLLRRQNETAGNVFLRERMGPGGLPGLQSLCRASRASWVGSIPTRSRHYLGRLRRIRLFSLEPQLYGLEMRILALILLTVMLLPAVSGRSAEAQPQPEESADPELGYFDTPTWVMMRSLAVPGWGQVHNRSWLKALFVVGVEGAMIERLLYEKNRVHYYRNLKYERPDEADYYQMKEDRHKGHRRDFIWWTSLFVFVSMWDAYVDAHLKYFDVELQTSPEVFEGAVPEETVDLSLRLSFGIGN
jgi:Family of unknown function (DUF5683)